MGRMLKDWEKQFPGRIENMASALQNVVPSHLMDRALHPFETLRATGEASEDGDKAFDDEPVPMAPRAVDQDEEAAPKAGNKTPSKTFIPIATH